MTSPDPLTDLTTEVHETAGKHENWLQEHGQLLSELVPNNELLTWLVAELGQHVKFLLDEVPPEATYPAINWASTPAETAERIWDELATWVRDVLVARFHPDRRELPDCWPLHVGAVENLLWLQRSWQLALAPRANQNLAAEWYTRWRAEALRELTAAIEREAVTSHSQKCSIGMHLGTPLPGAKRAQETRVPAPEPAGAAATPNDPGWPLPPGIDPNSVMAQSWTQPRVSAPTGHVDVYNDADDLAASEHWWPQFLKARGADLAQRRAREQERAAAEAVERQAADSRLAQRYHDEDGGRPA